MKQLSVRPLRLALGIAINAAGVLPMLSRLMP
jgi:hypothetical protein